MKLDLDAQFMIFQINFHMNMHFKKLLIDMYLEIAHLYRRTTIDEG